MKIIIPQNKLSKTINIAQRGVSNKSTLPILSGILIETVDNKIKLTGTDLELGIETYVEGEIVEEGSIVITSKIFGDIIKKLPDLPVEIDVSDNNIEIKCGHSKFNIVGQPAIEYPHLPEIDDEIHFQMPKDLLKLMIKQTVFATAQDETRPILTGSLLEVEKGKVALVSLDGYRLALKNANVDYDKDIKVVIPGKTLMEVNKILDDDDVNINIKFTSSHVLFDLGETVIISRLLEGQFLNYKDIIRNEYNTKVKVKTKDLQESIERASLLTREGRNNLVKFDIEDDKMIITSNSEIGNVQEEVDIELEGDDLKIAFNSKYMLDGLKVIDDDNIVMNLVSNVNPCIINPVEDKNYTYLVLPVRLAEDH
ncbi:DNA polymerase III subunit beta [Clostridiisalibacter paucivorans]|uniref:DNA polymerase III subunit beta n=1 Tax=Clostridiisalibacter paucivorans TaxID=408753 RepID=UPI000478AB50|nr:DNA polymerase III subunit beta [Clostridiisalibacter paucivorans]